MGIQNGQVGVKNSPAVPQKVKHRVTICLSSSSARDMLKRNEDICTHENLYRNVPRSILMIIKKIEITQMSIN